ncbi:MAG: pur operon repressor [Peptostreptococcaceae bacterium]|nr:pur operon repressor [Peptostreptococcaceae bacterium]
MKKNMRVGAIIKILTDSPNRIYNLKYFCDMFDAAKSSISEDISSANETVESITEGHIITIPGVGGGVKFIPNISLEKTKLIQEKLCSKLNDSSRILGGGFLYTSDIMFDSHLISELAVIFARKFRDTGANYVATVETKGIPLASMVAQQLNLPLVVIRREANYSEGSTVSINYFSGSYDRIQKMSIAKRAVEPGTNALIIDDFMRGGGSLKGLSDILSEFNITVVGIGVAIASIEPEKKKVSSFIPITYLENIDEEKKEIRIVPNSEIF